MHKTVDVTPTFSVTPSQTTATTNGLVQHPPVKPTATPVIFFWFTFSHERQGVPLPSFHDKIKIELSDAAQRLQWAPLIPSIPYLVGSVRCFGQIRTSLSLSSTNVILELLVLSRLFHPSSVSPPPWVPVIYQRFTRAGIQRSHNALTREKCTTRRRTTTVLLFKQNGCGHGTFSGSANAKHSCCSARWCFFTQRSLCRNSDRSVSDVRRPQSQRCSVCRKRELG